MVEIEARTADQLHLELGRMSRAGFLGRASALGLVVVGGPSLAAACGSSGSAATGTSAGNPVRGGTAQIAMAGASQKDTLDPMLMADNPQQFTCGLLYDPLFDVDETTWTPKPGLVETWHLSPDAKEYTFILRDGVKFHDGTPLTSAAVAYNLKRHTTKSVGSPMYARFAGVLPPSGIEIVDQKTVKLHLIKPDAYIPVALSLQWCGIVPAGSPAKGIGTGPFKLKSWTPGQGFEFDRNPDYWQSGKPYLDVVRAIDIEDPTSKVQSVISGASSITDQIEYAALPAVKSSSSAKLLTGENWAFQNVVFPASAPQFHDPRIVGAIKLAVDRQKMVEVGLAGNGNAVRDVCVPAGSPQMPSGLSLTPDIAGAKKLLSEAGFPNGIDIQLHTSDAVSHITNLAVEFAQTVAPAGIRVHVQQVPAQTYWDQNFLSKNAYLDWWSRLSAIDYVATLYRSSAPFNETDFSNTQFEALMDKAQATPDATTSASYIQQAMSILSDKASQVIAGFSTEYLAAKNDLQGAEPSVRYIVDFRNAYIG